VQEVKKPSVVHYATPVVAVPLVPRIDGGTTMATMETFNRGDEVLSKLPGGSIMIVLAVEGLKVRCADDQERQYWFDTNLLEHYHWTQPCTDTVEHNSLPAIFPDLHSDGHCDVASMI
jgi:hypothetical protein